MYRPTVKQEREEEQLRTHIINPKVPKMSQKIIDFDNMSSFESDADSRTKHGSKGTEQMGKQNQEMFNRKCSYC